MIFYTDDFMSIVSMDLQIYFDLLPINHDVEMLALDWDGHSKISHKTRLKSNRFILNHKLSERRSFLK